MVQRKAERPSRRRGVHSEDLHFAARGRRHLAFGAYDRARRLIVRGAEHDGDRRQRNLELEGLSRGARGGVDPEHRPALHRAGALSFDTAGEGARLAPGDQVALLIFGDDQRFDSASTPLTAPARQSGTVTVSGTVWVPILPSQASI